MTRIFTLTFPFKQKLYDAEITVDDSAAPNTILVYLPDRKLHRIMPEGKAVINVEEKQMELPKDAPPFEHLKYSILNAFNEYESKIPPVSMW